MKFGPVPPRDANGATAVHTIRQGSLVLKKGTLIGTAEIAALEAAGIMPELIEQPVPARDWAGLRHIAEQVNTPVLADESVFGPRDAIALLQQHGADMLNIKLMKSGGIGAALQLADIAALHGVPCMMGCMLESSVSVAAAATGDRGHAARARTAAGPGGRPARGGRGRDLARRDACTDGRTGRCGT